jgi:hypothetical protein
MKIVIDTDILINASSDESSYAFRIIKEVIEGRLEAFATHQTMSENRQMLRKLVKDREYRELVEEFFRKLKIIRPTQRLKMVSDPEDNKLFESAEAAGADYLITNDTEVLAVEEYRGTKVATPADFWAKYQDRSSDNTAWHDWSRMILGH